ncbi:unnamed protein product, partial [Rotaria sp. Silwood1]
MQRRGGLMNFWGQQMKSSVSTSTFTASDFASSSSPTTYQQSEDITICHEVPSISVLSPTVSTSSDANPKITPALTAPAQCRHTEGLNSIKDKLNKLYLLKSTGLLNEDNRKSIKDLEKQQKTLQQKIH